ncbi:MAG: hypothetical protein ACT4P6_19790 [Gemmatimonadaceae bacterium]
MPDEQVLVPRAHATGDWRGNTVAGDARVRLHQRGIVLAWHDARGGSGASEGREGSEWRVPFSDLSGVALRGDALVLYGAAGSVTLTSSYHMHGLCQAVLERACALPELARGARSVGSRRGGDPATQARFFAPLLDARRRAELQADAEGKVRALDGRAVAARVTELLTAVARARWPNDLPEQRALGAELEECCEGMLAACQTLAAAADAWFETPDQERLDAWRAWVAAAARLFEASDRAWGRVVTVLALPTRAP